MNRTLIITVAAALLAATPAVAQGRPAARTGKRGTQQPHPAGRSACNCRPHLRSPYGQLARTAVGLILLGGRLSAGARQGGGTGGFTVVRPTHALRHPKPDSPDAGTAIRNGISRPAATNPAGGQGSLPRTLRPARYHGTQQAAPGCGRAHGRPVRLALRNGRRHGHRQESHGGRIPSAERGALGRGHADD